MSYKSAFITDNNEWRVFKQSYLFNELNNIDIYENCVDVPFLGFIQSLQCDFYKRPSDITPEQYKTYDVILTIKPFLTHKFDHQKLFYFEPEPKDIQNWSNFNSVYDYLLDNYSDKTFEKTISCPYVYDIEKIKSYKQPKIKYKHFLQKHSINRFAGNYMTEKYGTTMYPQYYKSLSECEYGINLNTNGSAGQVIAECCILDVIMFARPHKLFTKLLLPEFCMVDTFDEAREKINFLQNNESEKRILLEKIQCNVQKHLSLDQFKKLINSLL